MTNSPSNSDQPDLTPQEIFGKILSPISILGEGEWGIAWLVTDENNQRFTLKFTDTKKGKNEADINQKLNRLFGFEVNPEDENCCALLLQHIEGQSIEKVITPHIKHLIENELGEIETVFNEEYLQNPIDIFASGLLRNITLALGVTKALARLHAADLSHGDVDLGNYILATTSRGHYVKAIDFGLSQDISKMSDRNKIAFAIGGDIMDLQQMLNKMLPANVMLYINELFDNGKIPSLSQIMKVLITQLAIHNSAPSNLIVTSYDKLRANSKRVALEFTKNIEPPNLSAVNSNSI